MTLVKNKKFNKKSLSLFGQIITIAVLFVFAFSGELTILAKDFLNKLECGAEFQTFLYRTLASLKMVMYSPSFFSVFMLLLQLMCFTTSLIIVYGFFIRPIRLKGEKIKSYDEKIITFFEDKKYFFLKISKLRNWDIATF